METDITDNEFTEEPSLNREPSEANHNFFYQPQQPMMQFQPPPPPPKTDFLGSIDKTTYIIAFVVFILGFFMGKTMQPVILRPG